jgi:hypothetical protein
MHRAGSRPALLAFLRAAMRRVLQASSAYFFFAAFLLAFFAAFFAAFFRFAMIQPPV